MSTSGSPLGGPLGDAIADAEPAAVQQLQQLAAPAEDATAKASALQAQAEQVAQAQAGQAVRSAATATDAATAEIGDAFSDVQSVETPGVPCGCGSHIPPAFDRASAQQAVVDGIGSNIKSNPLRQDYEDKVAGLSSYADQIRPDMTINQLADLAQQANQARRDLGSEYKDLTPAPLLDYIRDVNQARYGDPLGPTVDTLVNNGRTYTDIIKSAARPNPDVDKLLSGFGDWLSRKPDDYVKQCLPLIGAK
jgi:hypothetical protein